MMKIIFLLYYCSYGFMAKTALLRAYTTDSHESYVQCTRFRCGNGWEDIRYDHVASTELEHFICQRAPTLTSYSHMQTHRYSSCIR